MEKVIRILGTRGRITIPYEVQMEVGFHYKDVLSFAKGEDGQSIVIRKEKFCDNCRDALQAETPGISLEDFLTELSDEQKMAAVIFLTQNFMTAKSGENRSKA